MTNWALSICGQHYKALRALRVVLLEEDFELRSEDLQRSGPTPEGRASGFKGDVNK